MTRVNDSVGKMHKAAVNLRRVCKLLNLREHRHLHEEAGTGVDTTAHKMAEKTPYECLEVGGVERLIPEDMTSRGPMGALSVPSSSSALPLGRVIVVRGGVESSRNSCMALVARSLYPDKGHLDCPSDAWAVMLPPAPVNSPPQITVLGAVQLSDVSRKWLPT